MELKQKYIINTFNFVAWYKLDHYGIETRQVPFK